MAKILQDVELANIVARLVKDQEIDDADTYSRFLLDLAELITHYCGGDVGVCVHDDPGGRDLGWTVAIRGNDSVPEGGGIFKHYDVNGEL